MGQGESAPGRAEGAGRVTVLCRSRSRASAPRPGRARRSRGRRSGAARPGRIRDDACLRRRAVPAGVASRPARRLLRADGDRAARCGELPRARVARSRRGRRAGRRPSLLPHRGSRAGGRAAAARPRELAAAAARGPARARDQALVPARHPRRGSLAARRCQVHELRGQHGRRGGGTCARRRRRRLRHRRRDRARRARHESLVAAGLDALHTVARPRHPRRRHARGAARARAGERLRRAGGPVPARRPARRGRGVHVVVRARADPGRRAGRRSDRPRRRRADSARGAPPKRRYPDAVADKLRLGGMALGTACSCTGPRRGPARCGFPTDR